MNTEQRNLNKMLEFITATANNNLFCSPSYRNYVNDKIGSLVEKYAEYDISDIFIRGCLEAEITKEFLKGKDKHSVIFFGDSQTPVVSYRANEIIRSLKDLYFYSGYESRWLVSNVAMNSDSIQHKDAPACAALIFPKLDVMTPTEPFYEICLDLRPAGDFVDIDYEIRKVKIAESTDNEQLLSLPDYMANCCKKLKPLSGKRRTIMDYCPLSRIYSEGDNVFTRFSVVSANVSFEDIADSQISSMTRNLDVDVHNAYRDDINILKDSVLRQVNFNIINKIGKEQSMFA